MDNDINWEFRDIKRELSEIKNTLNKTDKSTTVHENKVKCEWNACANNVNGLCSSKDVKLENVTIDGVNYLNCDSFDFE